MPTKMRWLKGIYHSLRKHQFSTVTTYKWQVTRNYIVLGEILVTATIKKCNCNNCLFPFYLNSNQQKYIFKSVQIIPLYRTLLTAYIQYTRRKHETGEDKKWLESPQQWMIHDRKKCILREKNMNKLNIDNRWKIVLEWKTLILKILGMLLSNIWGTHSIWI